MSSNDDEKAVTNGNDNINETETELITSYACGIDLGTTYSCIAVWKNNSVEIIPDINGHHTIPSCVAFTANECLVGHEAKIQSIKNPQNTIFESKRIIGRKYDENSVKDDICRWPFKIKEIKSRNDSNEETLKCAYIVELNGNSEAFVPEQIGAMILLQLKYNAEQYLNAKVNNVVITVPAYFNDSQRQATKDAGTIAGIFYYQYKSIKYLYKHRTGLNVLRIINEPTAAALAYGVDTKYKSKLESKTNNNSNNISDNSSDDEDDEVKVLVFDLGGGTFDVSILTIQDGFFEVKATAGNTHLGGEDFDNRLTDYCVNQLINKYVQEYPNIFDDLRKNPQSMRKLREACENAKTKLSTLNESIIKVDNIIYDINFEFELTKNKFENLCMDLFKECLEPVEQVLRDSKLKKSDIDEIILVGGSTRVPKIREIIYGYFNKKINNNDNNIIDPDEAIAYGAAIQSAILTDSDVNKKDDSDKLFNDIFLLDVIPLSLGLETDNGITIIIYYIVLST